MITLDKITVQIGQKLFTQKTKKLLRIQTESSIIKTNSYAKVLSTTGLQWDEAIQLPLEYGKEMSFEIFQKHQFGYNPEQIVGVMHGVIVFAKGNDKYLNWEIFDVNQKKIGFLSVNIKNKPVTFDKIEGKAASPVNKIVDLTQLVTISSIIVNIPSIKSKHAYASISIGGQQVKTCTLKSKSGELVFIQKYDLQKIQQINQGILEIYTCGTDQNDEKVATAVIKLEKKIDKKLRFCDQEGNQIGEGFIDGKCQLKDDVLADRVFASMIKQSFRKETVSVTSPHGFTDLSRSLLSNKGFMRSQADQSLDLSTSRKRNSVINHNNNIRIPQQKRFFDSRDPSNNKCSYLPQQSFQFKQKNIDKYYRGASIGYGGKTDFTSLKKGLPSVGKYNLPSIWDRY